MTPPPPPPASDPGGGKATARIIEGLRRAPEDIAAIARRSRGVGIAKGALPAVAVLLLVALAVVPALRNAGRVTYHIKPGTAASGSGSNMQGAHYRGVDQNGEPYTLTASAADQGADGVVALTDPAGDVTLKSGSWVMLNSIKGTYHQESEKLGLTGNVTLYRDDGTTVKTSRAMLDLKGGTAEGVEPVHAEGPFGTLDATSGFSIADRGADITFHGPATLTLAPAPATPDPTLPQNAGSHNASSQNTGSQNTGSKDAGPKDNGTK